MILLWKSSELQGTGLTSWLSRSLPALSVSFGPWMGVGGAEQVPQVPQGLVYGTH